MSLNKNTYCSYCGAAFTIGPFPKACRICSNFTYMNPIPIVVTLLRTFQDEKMGLLIQQRNIEPQKGQWALPSGYIDVGESWEEAAAREVQEEMGIQTQPDKYKIWTVRNATNNNLLIFAEYSRLVWVEDFSPNEEVSAVFTILQPRELAFPTHTEEVTRWFDSLKK